VPNSFRNIVSKENRYTLSFFGWMALITILSLVSLSDSNMPKVNIPGLDKIVHFTFYGVATVLGCFYLRERTKGRKSIQLATVVFAIVTIIYGIVIEVLQHQMNAARDGDTYDALANMLGTFIGVALVLWLFSSKGPLQWKINA